MRELFRTITNALVITGALIALLVMFYLAASAYLDVRAGASPAAQILGAMLALVAALLLGAFLWDYFWGDRRGGFVGPLALIVLAGVVCLSIVLGISYGVIGN
jgi:hypothetical protein